jgi:hypothetical protein
VEHQQHLPQPDPQRLLQPSRDEPGLRPVAVGDHRVSQTLYRDIHNRHHRGNSDLPGLDGRTVDPLSIYQRGKNGQPENPWAYTFLSFSATIPSRSTTK